MFDDVPIILDGKQLPTTSTAALEPTKPPWRVLVVPTAFDLPGDEQFRRRATAVALTPLALALDVPFVSGAVVIGAVLFPPYLLLCAFAGHGLVPI